MYVSNRVNEQLNTLLRRRVGALYLLLCMPSCQYSISSICFLGKSHNSYADFWEAVGDGFLKNVAHAHEVLIFQPSGLLKLNIFGTEDSS